MKGLQAVDGGLGAMLTNSAAIDARKRSAEALRHWAGMMIVAVGFVTSLCCSTNVLVAQEGAAEAPAAATAELPAIPKGRLPAYFKDIVSEDQRDEIYKIQQQYADKIDALAAQIKSMQETRDSEIDAVLSAEQLAEVTKLRADASAKRKARAAELKSKDKPKAAAAAATTETAATAATSSKPALAPKK